MASSNPNRRGGFPVPAAKTPSHTHTSCSAVRPRRRWPGGHRPSHIFLRLTLWCLGPKSPTTQAPTLLRLNFRSSSSPLAPSIQCLEFEYLRNHFWGGGCCRSDSFSLGDTPFLGSVSSPAQPTRNPAAHLQRPWEMRACLRAGAHGLPPGRYREGSLRSPLPTTSSGLSSEVNPAERAWLCPRLYPQPQLLQPLAHTGLSSESGELGTQTGRGLALLKVPPASPQPISREGRSGTRSLTSLHVPTTH